MAQTPDTIFTEAGDRYNAPDRVVTLGAFYPQVQAGAARGILREARAGYGTSDFPSRLREGVDWTRTISALVRGRRWPQRRLFDLLDPLLAGGIAITVVPSHAAYAVDAPIRELARLLAVSQGRVDATGCLERHTSIARILFGGPSTRPLHRQTIHIIHPEVVAGRPVLLLDDIAKSGASLAACRELLLEAGASVVQAVALARVTAPPT